MKGTTDKLVPASMIQNKTIFELNGNVINAVISGAGSRCLVDGTHFVISFQSNNTAFFAGPSGVRLHA